MKLVLLAFLMALSGTMAILPHGGWGRSRWVVSRRDADAAEPVAEPPADADGDGGDDESDDDDEEPPTQAQLSEIIDGVLEDAKEGMAVEQMALEAMAIQTVADALVESQGGDVSKEETENEIDDAAAGLSGLVAVSSLFDEPMEFENNKMDAALCILNNLNKQAQQEVAEGKPSKATVAAISMTAQAVQEILEDAVGIYAFSEAAAEEEAKEGGNDVNKRWAFEGGYSRGPGGNSWNAKISHSWNGRRKREVTKRGKWNGHVGVSRGPGGYGVSGGVSYTWGRR